MDQMPIQHYTDIDIRHIHEESKRLDTFTTGWINNAVEPRDLVSAGFFFTGILDIVACYICNVQISEWTLGDVPIDDHKKFSPLCPFVKYYEDRLGKSPEELEGFYPPVRSVDVCGTGDMVSAASYLSPSSTTSNVGGGGVIVVSEEELEDDLLLTKLEQPLYHEYARNSSRLRTFDTWPKALEVVDKKKLADAGFFYSGKSDRTFCFYCGAGFKDWEIDDDPFLQHRINKIECIYSRLILESENERSVNLNRIKRNINKSKNIVSGDGDDTAKKDTVNNLPDEQKKKKKTDNKEGKVHGDISSLSLDDEDDDKNRWLCRICIDKEVSVVFFPCKHVVSCLDCAYQIKRCAWCRCEIDKIMKVFCN